MSIRRLKAIVGLGNPGRQYEGTRHNVGFAVLDGLAAQDQIHFKRSWRLRARSCTMRVSDLEILLIKPQVFMNRSGQTAAALQRRGVAPEEMLVVVDDVDLPPGRIRIRSRGGAGGHNGLKSVIGELGSDAFPRVRIGVGSRPPDRVLTDHVLGPFSPEERVAVEAAMARAMEAIRCAVADGIEAAMNRYNADPA